MDSVIMTTPSNSMRLRSRLRSAANQICARSSKNRSGTNLANKSHHHHRTNGSMIMARNLINRHHHQQHGLKHANVNLQCPIGNCENDNVKLKPVIRLVNMTAFSREVYNAWCGRLGDVTRIPSDSVQSLFNDMQLYPSKNQVVEMLQCARQCSRRNSSQFLTFGEFCVFAGELRRGAARNRYQHHQHNTSQIQRSLNTNKTPITQCEVFLGGSCNPTTWRADIAIPTFSKLGISYYNPQVSTWGPELMAAEHSAKESAAVLLFVVDSQTRCVAGMLEVAHLVAKQRCLVLVVHPFTRNQAIMGETLSAQEYLDLAEGQTTLLTLVRNQNVTVHSNLTTALQCTVNLLRGPESILENTTERKLSDKLIKLREVFDLMDKNHTGQLSLSEVMCAYYQLTGLNLRIADLRAIMDLSLNGDNTDVRISFEQFCGIVAEFTTPEGCNNTTRANNANSNGTDGANRFTNFTYWKLAMLRTQQLLRIYVVQPIVHIIDWISIPLQHQTSTNNNTNYTRLKNGFHSTHEASTPLDTFYDIYLGGSCIKRTTWRQNIAIPLLKRYGITYYNPSLHENNVSALNGDINDNDMQLLRSASRNLLHDMDVMSNSKIVLFIITNETRSITSMILAAHFIAIKKNVVLCVQQLPLEDCIIETDVITKQAIKDYNRARAYLSDLAKHENIPTFETVQDAVECAIGLVQQHQQQQQQW